MRGKGERKKMGERKRRKEGDGGEAERFKEGDGGEGERREK